MNKQFSHLNTFFERQAGIINLELPALLDLQIGQWWVTGLWLREYLMSASGKFLP